MKNHLKYFLFLFLVFCAGGSYGQTTTKIQADSVKIYQVGGSAELILENATKARTKAVLRNKGNGRTEFSFAVDSVWQVSNFLKFLRGADTLTFDLSSTHTHDGLAPSGGTTGQVLRKLSNTNYDYAWSTDTTDTAPIISWGDIEGTLSDQADLDSALATKQDLLPVGSIYSYIRGDHTLGNFATDVKAVGDTVYSPLNHTHAALPPVGGLTGQVLKKLSGNDYDYVWANDNSGGAGGPGGNADSLDGEEGLYYLNRANHTGTQPFSTITGTVPYTQGGTGLSSLGAAGQLLKVNAGATALEYFTPAYLTSAVTNVATGYGLSGGPITTTGTLLVDSLTIATKLFVQHLIDSLAAQTSLDETFANANLTFTADRTHDADGNWLKVQNLSQLELTAGGATSTFGLVDLKGSNGMYLYGNNGSTIGSAVWAAGADVSGAMAGIDAFNASTSNNFYVRPDSSLAAKKISYTQNLGSTFTIRSLVDKGYVDSVLAAAGGGASLRFGKSGEDATASENRTFNANNFEVNIDSTLSWRLTNKKVGLRYSMFDGSAANSNWYSLYDSKELAGIGIENSSNGSNVMIEAQGAHDSSLHRINVLPDSIVFSGDDYRFKTLPTKALVANDSILIADVNGKIHKIAVSGVTSGAYIDVDSVAGLNAFQIIRGNNTRDTIEIGSTPIGTLEEDLNAGGFKITNLADPVDDQDAATLAIVKYFAAGNVDKASTQYATTAALAANTYNNTLKTITMNSVGVVAIDGHNMVLGESVLIKNEADQTHNGIYTVTTEGTVSVAAVFTRRSDYDENSEVGAGTKTYIESGTSNGGSTWTQITTGSPTLGSTNLVFSQTAGGGLADGSVTNPKLAQVPANTLKGTNNGATSQVEDLTTTEVRAMLSINNVDNTSDANKPVSTAQTTAINAKVADAINDGTTTVAPSQNAVFDALALKQDASTNNGGWTTLRRSGTDFTTTSTTLTDITGLVTSTLSTATLYEFEAVLFVNSSSTAGMTVGIQQSGTGSGQLGVFSGTATSGAATAIAIGNNALNGASASCVLVNGNGTISIKGYVMTGSSGSPTISLKVAKTTSGTATVKIGSKFSYRLAQ